MGVRKITFVLLLESGEGGTHTELNAFHTLHSVFIRSNVVGTGREETFFSLLISKLSFIVIMPFITIIIINSFRIEILH